MQMKALGWLVTSRDHNPNVEEEEEKEERNHKIKEGRRGVPLSLFLYQYNEAPILQGTQTVGPQVICVTRYIYSQPNDDPGETTGKVKRKKERN